MLSLSLSSEDCFSVCGVQDNDDFHNHKKKKRTSILVVGWENNSILQTETSLDRVKEGTWQIHFYAKAQFKQ